MREIKFRAWDKSLKSWIGEGVFFSEGKAYILRGQLLVECDADVVQYTGLHDKNGKEIYEGDILADDEFYIKKSVEWIKNSYQLVHHREYVNTHGAFISRIKHLEVIGNIYENPELLENRDTLK